MLPPEHAVVGGFTRFFEHVQRVRYLSKHLAMTGECLPSPRARMASVPHHYQLKRPRLIKFDLRRKLDSNFKRIRASILFLKILVSTRWVLILPTSNKGIKKIPGMTSASYKCHLSRTPQGGKTSPDLQLFHQILKEILHLSFSECMT